MRRTRLGTNAVSACYLACLTLVTALFLPDFASAKVQVASVTPAATDAAINESFAPHRVYFDPDAPRRNELLVFLPGTGGRNAGPPRAFSVTAAQLGYHVIDLAYPNSISATVCWQEQAPGCFENFRREIIEGLDTSPLIDVARADSIEHRLEKLLQLLAVRQPRRGWGQFLEPSGKVAWESVALAGQSQGGGHAALIARDHKVARVLLFGSPKDYDQKQRKPAAWYRPGLTPAERFFALVHSGDRQGCSFPEQLEIFRAMGIASKPVNVDVIKPPSGTARILVSNYPGRKISSKDAHVAGISNQHFKQVWDFMLTAGKK